MAATCGLDFERRLSASSFEVRRSIAEALREMGFEITVDQLTRMEAKRGSLLGSSLMLKKQMPVLAVFEISTDASGCVVLVHLTDNIRNLVGKTWGVNRQYREILAEVQRRVDLGLAKLDGAASLAFAEATFWSRAADVGLIEQSNVLTAKAVGLKVDLWDLLRGQVTVNSLRAIQVESSGPSKKSHLPHLQRPACRQLDGPHSWAMTSS